MNRKMIAVIMAVVLCLSLSGCIALFSDTYHHESEFSGGDTLEFDPNMEVVRNYAELRRFIFGLVNDHIESSEVLFSGYAGNAVSDIASVCNAVKTESAYGAFCVDYVAYDLTQIVSSYEAVIKISYLYTQEELNKMLTTSNHDSLATLIAGELERETERIIVKVNNGSSDSGTVLTLVEQIMRNHPLSISYYPKVSVKIFSGNSSQKIYELTIVYDDEIDNEQRLRDMNNILDKAISGIRGDVPSRMILAAAESLSGLWEFSNAGGDTAYDALVIRQSNSEGVACAFKALCDKLGIECMVVSGRMGKADHYWNIVKVENDYYHVDISVLNTLGAESALFLRDSDKQVDCWWNQSEYPDCDGELTYSALVS